MRRSHRTIATCLLLQMAASAQAIPSQPSAAGLYLRARAAEAAGDVGVASAGFAALIAQDGVATPVVMRAYRQAIVGGEMGLAVRAARLLDARQALPPDGRLLLILTNIRAGDWQGARIRTDGLAKDPAFGFLAPYLRSWIAFGSGQGDALKLLDASAVLPVAAPYRDEQRAFLLVAMGRGTDAYAALSKLQLRPAEVKGPEQGLALLFTHLASDFKQQKLIPIGLVMARLATYTAPDLAAGWLVLADMLRAMQRSDLALAALSHVNAKDPLAPTAAALRIAALHDTDRNDEALAEALAIARTTGAGAQEWSRVGDIYIAMDKASEAADAYAKAIQAAEASGVPSQSIWPLLLQQGAALDQAGNWPAAKAALVQAHRLAPDQAIVLNQLGYAQLEHHENVDEAAALIAKANSLRPDDPAITDSLGWVTYLRGNARDAAPLIERAAAASPAEPEINEHLGDVYWALGRQYEARYAWRAALVTAEEKDRRRLNAKIDEGLAEATAKP